MSNIFLREITNLEEWGINASITHNCYKVPYILDLFLNSKMVIAEVCNIEELYSHRKYTLKPIALFRAAFLTWRANCWYTHKFKKLGIKEVEMNIRNGRIMLRKIMV